MSVHYEIIYYYILKIIDVLPKLFIFFKKIYYYSPYQHKPTIKISFFLLTYCAFDMKKMSDKFQLISLCTPLDINLNIWNFFLKILCFFLFFVKKNSPQHKIQSLCDFSPYITSIWSYSLVLGVTTSKYH